VAANSTRYGLSEIGVACPAWLVVIGALIPTDAGAGSDQVPGAPLYHGVTDGSDLALQKSDHRQTQAEIPMVIHVHLIKYGGILQRSRQH
jgi:hypothetical protein